MTVFTPFPHTPGNGNDSVPFLDRYDLRLFATPRSNCLLIGPDALVDDALTAWQPFLGHAPVFLASLYYRLNTMTISLGVPP